MTIKAAAYLFSMCGTGIFFGVVFAVWRAV